jgi:putative membrane protein insertion efficiency factor
MTTLAILLLKFYKFVISPITTSLFGNACRFTPSCSTYTIRALEEHGFLKGFVLGIKRIGKCHPWGGGGYDPVPLSKN